uniref:Uncharacterized protein n=1 Tax=Arundo donax TaxID=35708 RepID=A0A0A8YQE2_ARUDO
MAGSHCLVMQLWWSM